MKKLLTILFLSITLICNAQYRDTLNAYIPFVYDSSTVSYYSMDSLIKVENNPIEILFEYNYDTLLREDTLEVYIVYANLDEPSKPFTSDNAYIVLCMVFIDKKEVSILCKAYDSERDVFIKREEVLYYEIKP